MVMISIVCIVGSAIQIYVNDYPPTILAIAPAVT